MHVQLTEFELCSMRNLQKMNCACAAVSKSMLFGPGSVERMSDRPRIRCMDEMENDVRELGEICWSSAVTKRERW